MRIVFTKHKTRICCSLLQFSLDSQDSEISNFLFNRMEVPS